MASDPTDEEIDDMAMRLAWEAADEEAKQQLRLYARNSLIVFHKMHAGMTALRNMFGDGKD